MRANSQKLGTNPDQIAVWGSSAGGHFASMLGSSRNVQELEGNLVKHLEQSSRVQAVFKYFGPSEFLRMDDFPSAIKHLSSRSPESQLIGRLIWNACGLALQASPIL